MVVQGILAVRSIYDSVTSIPLTFGVLEALQTPTVLNITGNTTVGPELPVRIVPETNPTASLPYYWRQALAKGRTISVFILHSNTGPLMANTFMCLIEEKLESEDKLPSFYKRYMDDTLPTYQGTNSILKGTSPKELAAYSNRFVTQEVKVICPFWHASVVRACGVHKSEEKEMKASNAIALATSATSRTRNQRMSALASCISVILLLSGAKTQDFTRLNKLGVSMSHRQSIRLQTAMGHNFNGKVLQWKKNREEVKVSCFIFFSVHLTLRCATPTFQGRWLS